MPPWHRFNYQIVKEKRLDIYFENELVPKWEANRRFPRRAIAFWISNSVQKPRIKIFSIDVNRQELYSIRVSLLCGLQYFFYEI